MLEEEFTTESILMAQNILEGMKGFDVTHDLDRINCPVLVIGSMDDHVLSPDASERIVEHLNSRAELHMYDGYGHAAYDTAPDYKERIYSFLRNRLTGI